MLGDDAHSEEKPLLEIILYLTPACQLEITFKLL